MRPEFLDFAEIGATQQLSASAQKENGDTTDVTFTWASSDPSILEVNSGGLVTARDNGHATITVHANGTGITSSVEGRVNLPDRMVITPEAWPANEVWIGARRQFEAHLYKRDVEVPDAPIIWSTSNDRVVRVDETGLVTAHGSGTAQITATFGEFTGRVTITVNREGSNVAGYMYTTWGAVTDDTPAVIAGGRLRVSETYYPNDDFPDGNIPYHDIQAPWSRATVEKFQYAGDRIGLLTDMANGVGTLRVVDRATEWSILALGNAQDFAFEGNRIAVLLEGGELRVKEGISGAWSVLAASGVTQFDLEGNRYGVLREDGRVLVKEGINGAWHLLDPVNVTHFQLEGDRIGVLTKRNEFLVTNRFDEPFTTLATEGATRFRLEVDRIALEAYGEFRVKDGLHAPWTLLAAEPIRQFALEGDRIGILSESGMLRVKNGIHGTWHIIASDGVRDFQLQGDRIGRLTQEGRLIVRAGFTGRDHRTEAYGAGVTQFRLIVDNPRAPHRTTPTSYAAGQARCNELDEEDGDPVFDQEACYPEYSWRPVAPYYGVYCGKNRPGDMSTAGRARGVNGGLGGPIDGMDFLCQHHDAVGSWYPETFGGAMDGDVFAACVVRYGLIHGQLTNDGAVIATGLSDPDTWNNAWGNVMPNLEGALDGYFTYTFMCESWNLADFDEMTDASH